MTARLLALAGVLALGVALGVFVWPRGAPPPAAAVPASAPASAPAASPPGVAAAPPGPAVVLPAPRPAGERLYLPDGSSVPALNGVTGLAPVAWWPRWRPWSPIVGRRTEPDGTEWYVHQDGTRTTTRMVWRSELGRKDAAVEVAEPMAPLSLPQPAAPASQPAR